MDVGEQLYTNERYGSSRRTTEVEFRGKKSICQGPKVNRGLATGPL